MLPFVQVRADVYCASWLALPAPICSKTVDGTFEETVATADVKGPRPVPLDVMLETVVPVAVTLTP